VKQVRVQRLWLLIAICIVGINAFQGYWLWRQYQAQQRNFAVTVKGALAQATQQVQLGKATQIIQDIGSLRSKIRRVEVDTAAWTPHQDSDTLIYVALSKLSQPTVPTVQLHAIDSVFALELLKRGITETYHLDTIRMDKADIVQHSISASTEKIDIHINTDQRMLMVMENPEEPDTGRFITVTAPVGMMEHCLVRASFPRHNYYVIGGIAGALGAGLVLTLLTAGAFFYLLYIIQQQKKLAALKSDFISAMTHELQTPIATSSAAIEALQHFNALDNPERTSAYLEIAQSQLNQLSGMVDQTLRLAAEERAGFSIHRQTVDLNAFVPPILDRARLAAGRATHLEFDNPLNRLVSVDQEYFTWAIQNLIDNAIKYCPHDRIPEVRVCAFATNDQWWSLSVTDNGTGIPIAYQPRLFERFFRVPSDTNIKGFGLGLYVVQRIAHGHGGQVLLHSSTPQGSVFILEIPFTQP
jgi:two-component system, OmpR family, phosphate regulon sensor histidine kinase PhoR